MKVLFWTTFGIRTTFSGHIVLILSNSSPILLPYVVTPARYCYFCFGWVHTHIACFHILLSCNAYIFKLDFVSEFFWESWFSSCSRINDWLWKLSFCTRSLCSLLFLLSEYIISSTSELHEFICLFHCDSHEDEQVMLKELEYLQFQFWNKKYTSLIHIKSMWKQEYDLPKTY